MRGGGTPHAFDRRPINDDARRTPAEIRDISCNSSFFSPLHMEFVSHPSFPGLSPPSLSLSLSPYLFPCSFLFSIISFFGESDTCTTTVLYPPPPRITIFSILSRHFPFVFPILSRLFPVSFFFLSLTLFSHFPILFEQ